MTIAGKLVDVGVDAKSGIGQTTLNAKSRMVVQVKNHADGSQVRETLTSTGASQVFWFDLEDAQQLLNELYNKNFEKFVTDTTLDGKVLKLRNGVLYPSPSAWTPGHRVQACRSGESAIAAEAFMNNAG